MKKVSIIAALLASFAFAVPQLVVEGDIIPDNIKEKVVKSYVENAEKNAQAVDANSTVVLKVSAFHERTFSQRMWGVFSDPDIITGTVKTSKGEVNVTDSASTTIFTIDTVAANVGKQVFEAVK